MKLSKNLKIALAIIAGIVIAWGAFFGFYKYSYANKVLAGVSAAGISVAGLPADEAQAKLNGEIEDFMDTDLRLESGDSIWLAKPAELGIRIDLADTIDKAVAVGRDAGFFANLWAQTQSVFVDKDISATFSIDQSTLEKYIVTHLGDKETPAQNATLTIEGSTAVATESQTGIIVDRDEFLSYLEQRARNLRATPVQVPFTTAFPVIDIDDVESAKLAVVNLLAEGLTLNHHEKSWSLPANQTSELIVFTPRSKSGRILSEQDIYSKGMDKDDPDIILGIELQGEDYDKFLEDIAAEIYKAPENARFQIKDEDSLEVSLSGKKDPDTSRDLELETLAQQGEEMDMDLTKEDILKEINHGRTSLDLRVNVSMPMVNENNYEEIGIEKLIGRGTSNFSGSPRNRIHNIGVGADRFDSVLIPAGETFSFNDILGPVNADTGYLPELVIKENDTIPEYGGGLCQVSTTTFRAAIDTGLPITERHNHAYAVQYYSPQGTDSTIYPPAVDLKFVNDTPAAILIQTKVVGKTLIFDFFGTYDGREIEKTSPRTFGYFGAGGMKAEWGYTVTMDGVVMTENIFKSTYRPPSEFHKSDEEEKKKQEEEEKKKQEEEAKKKAEEEAKKKQEESEGRPVGDDKDKTPTPTPTPTSTPTPSPSTTPKAN